MVHLFQKWYIVLSSWMRGGKRKKPDSGSDVISLAPTVPTLKQYIWGELTSVIKKHSTVPLNHATINNMAMKKIW